MPPTAGDADIARIAALIGEPSRARVLMALAGGRALTAGRLAAEARVSASTISEHLARLLDAQLLHAERSGRVRYFRLADESVARALEALAEIAPPEPVRSLRQSTRAQSLRRARTCYSHLAGRLGVALMAALLKDEQLVAVGNVRQSGEKQNEVSDRDTIYRLTTKGHDRLAAFGIDVGAVMRKRAPIRYCVDWSEQQPHLAGALGTALTRRLFDLSWIEPAAHPRAVTLTEAGRVGLHATFGLPHDWCQDSL